MPLWRMGFLWRGRFWRSFRRLSENIMRMKEMIIYLEIYLISEIEYFTFQEFSSEEGLTLSREYPLIQWEFSGRVREGEVEVLEGFAEPVGRHEIDVFREEGRSVVGGGRGGRGRRRI